MYRHKNASETGSHTADLETWQRGSLYFILMNSTLLFPIIRVQITLHVVVYLTTWPVWNEPVSTKRHSQTVDRTLWWQLGSVHSFQKFSGHSLCRVYCTVPGTSKHSPFQCLLQLPSSDLARAPCFTLLWKQDRLFFFSFGGGGGGDSNRSFLFYSQSCSVANKLKQADTPLYCNTELWSGQAHLYPD